MASNGSTSMNDSYRSDRGFLTHIIPHAPQTVALVHYITCAMTERNGFRSLNSRARWMACTNHGQDEDFVHCRMLNLRGLAICRWRRPALNPRACRVKRLPQLAALCAERQVNTTGRPS